MKKPLKRSAAHIYRLLVTVVVILLLVSVTLLWTPSFYWVALVILFFVAFQYNFPLSLLNNEINLIHIIAMGGGLLYGPVVAGWSTALGIWLGYLIRRFNWFGQSQRSASTEEPYLNAGYTMGLQVIPLIIALFLSGGVQGIVTNPGSSDQRWLPTLLPLALYAIIHSLLFLVDFLLSRRYPSEERRRGLLLLALVEVLPLPFILIAVVAYPLIGIGTLIILGSIPAFLAVFIYEFNRTHADLERRVQELSTLNQISRVLRSTLDLENLLTVIQVQVTQLLAVDNFYVALYDPNEQRLWYPLAVKHGKRQHWAQRPLMPDRLTDRVINEGKHILLSPSAHDAQGRIGLPSSEESPQAWMGVPLITSDHTIGCLAVFSASPDSESEFTQADLNLLTILSGQVSVAIENALLYEQTQRRAAQLETLNRISSLITASLDPQEVLAQVCRSVTQVGGGQRSAIFLLDPDKGQVFLAHAHGLSSDFSHA
ncbi:MAG: GAF domain-containing protein, partial [Chloroflexota bacterium]